MTEFADLVMAHIEHLLVGDADEEVVGEEAGLVGQAVPHTLQFGVIRIQTSCLSTWEMERGWPWSLPPESLKPHGSLPHSLGTG